MAVIIKGKTVTPQKKTKSVTEFESLRPQIQQEEEPVVYEGINTHDNIPQRSPTRQVMAAQPRRRYARDEHLLVVGGKEKKIGKQSGYLLDMLTIDE